MQAGTFSVVRAVAVLLGLGLMCGGMSWASSDCADPNAAEQHADSPGSSGSLAYTKRAGSAQMAFAGIGGRVVGGAENVSSVQLGGQPMTQIESTLVATNAWASLWMLPNPPAGTVNLTFNLSVAPTNGDYIVWVCNNVDLISPIRSSHAATGVSETPSSTPPTVDGTDTVLDYFASDAIGTPTIGPDQTLIHDGTTSSSNAGASYQSGVNGGNMTWGIISDDWGSIAAAVRDNSPADAGGGAIWFE